MIDDYWRKLAEAQLTSEHNAAAKQQRAAADRAGQLAYSRTQTKLEVSKFLAVMKRAGNPGMIRLLVDDDYDKVMTIVKDFKGNHEHALGLKEYFLTSRPRQKQYGEQSPAGRVTPVLLIGSTVWMAVYAWRFGQRSDWHGRT
jgi:hypothetical protein